MFLMMLARYMARNLTPHIDRSKCLRYGSKDTCNCCLLSCPADAIMITDQVYFEEGKCRGCGTCTAACPTKCLYSNEINWLHKLSRVYSADIAEFGCSVSKNNNINVVVPCLGGIPAEVFAAVDQITGHQFTLDIGPCKNCHNRKVIRQIRSSLRQAAKLLGRPLRYRMLNSYKKNNPTIVEHHNNRLTVEPKELERLKRIWVDHAGTFLNSQISGNQSNSGNHAETESTKLPPQKMILIMTVNLNKNASFNLPSWQVSASCSACNLCVGNCLQSAWDIVFDDDRACLTHNPLRCTACGLCHKRCPQNALEPASVIWSKTAKKVFIKRVFTTKKCEICNKAFIASGTEDQRCKLCINREHLRSSIKATLM